MELSADDLESLRRSATDLSDICPCQRRRIDAGFQAAYERAEEIPPSSTQTTTGQADVREVE